MHGSGRQDGLVPAPEPGNPGTAWAEGTLPGAGLGRRPRVRRLGASEAQLPTGGAHTSDEGVTPETEQSCQENSVKESVYLSINKNDGLMKSRTETTKESLSPALSGHG